MARDAARERELFEEPSEAFRVLRDPRIDLAVRSLEIRIRNEARAAVPRAGDVDHTQIARLDDAIEVDVDEVQAGRRSPVPEETRLGVLERERLAEERVVEQVDLADGKIVRRPPPGVHFPELVLGEGSCLAHERRLRRRGGGSEAGRHGSQESLEIERLFEYRGDARGEKIGRHFAAVPCGGDDHRNPLQRRVCRAEAEDVPAGDPGHHQIEDHEIGFAGSHHVERFPAVARLDKSKTVAAQNGREQESDARIVVHDEHRATTR